MIQFSKSFLFNYKSFHIYITVCFPIYYQVLCFYKIIEKERSLPYTCFHGFLFECHCQKNFRKVHNNHFVHNQVRLLHKNLKKIFALMFFFKFRPYHIASSSILIVQKHVFMWSLFIQYYLFSIFFIKIQTFCNNPSKVVFFYLFPMLHVC